MKTKTPKNIPIYKYPQDLATKRGVNGLGLFAKVPMKKGDCIIEYIGEVINDKEANNRGGRYLFQTSKDRHIDGTTRSNIARYINHSCRPNCEVDIIKGRVFVYAKRKIEPGEELAYDYGKEYWDEHIKPKGCGCVKCVEKRSLVK
ncbi:SET domain-containing protein-lysine N-methyltransferase [Candidatus Nomurabacteria bacterium]|nr:SET domain-containing protein-lysine N-methyltransferase [Candidatus Nomurabacteria bacterium]